MGILCSDPEKNGEDIMIEIEKVVELTSEAVIIASTTFRDDQIRAYEKAISNETNESAKWVLKRILKNAQVAERRQQYPLCNDTGTPHVYLEIGKDAELCPGFFDAIREGVRKGLRTLPTRPMAVKGEPMERLAQTKGLYDDPGELVPGPYITEAVPGDQAYITIMMLGGGPELRAKTYRIYHLKSGERVLREAVGWAVEEVARLGCTPCVPAIGIGRTHCEATALMLRALRYGRFDQQNEWERMVVDTINATRVGPLGLGGKTTALGAFIEIGPQRASGARIVCLRLGCCFDPRRATVIMS